MQNIVLTTPTGNIGSKVLKALIEEPTISLTLIVRNPETIPKEIAEKCQIISGAIQDEGVLENALKDAHSLFWCTPPPDRTSQNIQLHYQLFAELVATQISNSPVQRVVTISSGGKGLAQNAGYISALHKMEDKLNLTGKSMRHLQTASHMENYLNHVFSIAKQNQFSVPLEADFKIPMVCSKDIAAVAAHWLIHNDWEGQKGVPVQGLEDLSCNDIAQIFSVQLHKTIKFNPISIDQFEQNILQHSQNSDLSTNLRGMYTEISQGIYNAEPRTKETTTPTSFATWTDETFMLKYNEVING